MENEKMMPDAIKELVDKKEQIIKDLQEEIELQRKATDLLREGFKALIGLEKTQKRIREKNEEREAFEKRQAAAAEERRKEMQYQATIPEEKVTFVRKEDSNQAAKMYKNDD